MKSRSLRGFALVFLLPAFAGVPQATSLPADHAAHVVVITVDGLRPDAIAQAGTVNIARLMREGAASLTARAVEPPTTLPNHLSMVTGVTPATHGVTTDKELDHDIGRPTLFTAVHGAGLPSALYIGKAKLLALAPAGTANSLHGPGPGDTHWSRGAPAALAADFAREFAAQRFAFVLIHLREPDLAGHKYGWMSPEYLTAVRTADQAVGLILDTIDQSGLRSTTTVLLTSDHGGKNKEHWGKNDADWIIPFICRGPGVKAGGATGEAATPDIAPTVLRRLALPSLPGTEGHAIEACLPH